MKLNFVKFKNTFFIYIVLTIATILGCSKDTDLLLDSVITDETIAVEEKENSSAEAPEVIVTPVDQIDTSQEPPQEVLESRTTSFSPTNDAHVQSGKIYNQNIIRLDEESRTSYLMFDLRPIAAINGIISEATLQFTIDSDNGNGNINVHKGDSSNWSEQNINEENIPLLDEQIGSILKEYKLGETQFIDLNVTSLSGEVSTLILVHQNGDDLAFASKEHTSKIGPKLVITYEVASGSPELVIVEEQTPVENTPQNEQPIVIADASPSTGGVPLTVNFTGSNSSDDSTIANYSWNFKDGATASEANPTHTFNTVGSYEVELTVTDNEGLTSTETVTITVNEEANEGPTARANASPITGPAPLEVNFNGSASTDDVSIVKYEWEFKDGETGDAANLAHTYTEPGTYVAILTVTDENGLFDKSSVSITVTEPVNEAPVAIATVNRNSGTAPLAIQFTGSNSTDDKEITKYTWDFKDGSTSTSANPSHTFTTAGNYAVTLTVEDAEGLSHTRTIGVTINEAQENQAPVAVVSANPTSGTVPLTVQFSGSNSTDDTGITSYFWDFKNGATSTSANPSHTFNQAGSYTVDLTVTDAAGLSNQRSITINANAPVGNTPTGFYVATNGNASNSGTSPSSPWSLEHAFFTAEPGDVIYVKAGNYGAKELITRNSGNNGAPIRFVGYRNTPGDITSTNGPTFNFGETVNSTRMPLLSSSNYNAIAFHIQDEHIHIENFQINGYGNGIISSSNSNNVTIKNVVLTNTGNQTNSSSYDGFAIALKGPNSNIANCFVQNANAQAITLDGSDNSLVSYCEVYATNSTNPTDYYYLLSNGTSNSRVENSLADRASGLSHGGHGFNAKDDATYNTFRNCTARRTSFKFTNSGAHHNTIDGGAIYGVSTSSGQWHARLSIIGGAHHNTAKNLLIQDTWAAISWTSFDSENGVDANIGNDNIFENITVKNTNRILGVGGGTNYTARAERNKFINCNFDDFGAVAVTYYRSNDIEFRNCSFRNGDKFVVEVDGVYAPYSHFDASWINCTWQNVNFTPPN